MKKIFEVITSGGSRYPVLCGSGSAAAIKNIWKPEWQTAAVIGDSNTIPLYGNAIAGELEKLVRKVAVLTFPAGEENKTRETKARLEDGMFEAGLDRTCCVVGVGGGVALDIAGFVAATYMRGVKSVYVATTLLAQVDAAIGGKTGVDTPFGKNLVGSFFQPSAVLIDIQSLSTLPTEEICNGMAEAVKSAVIADRNLFERIEELSKANMNVPEEVILRCARIKAGVVGEDEFEGGLRQILNFGHTVGHAIEKAMSYRIKHGEAVSTGMVVEAVIASELCGFPAGEITRLAVLLRKIGLPIRPQCAFADIAPHLGMDKKSRGGQVRCSLPVSIGEMDKAGGKWSREVPPEVVEAAMKKAISLSD